ncbi:MAG: hypothetical protein A2998_00745 [Candidatus Staskawiczbacteria bacterium RIFCSPLOWO2_01_FULL_37_25b]|uniref:Uncharacterized protein n=2 Tax=Candidatus Staskawicziibacteriota TaxID=1817916 RepID=A0A1G2HK50_9BACT|nr:MAG: hypothetical protein A2812_01495 [Candidatus Staskawiczbacteria bacterium RIFCSPHIGHO2_01_FULL_36_16]OGZ71864.1 MAG: hypothetical protein A2998_00745 [Candidatus Staskawiczbacteria bacterium RIFCSPLOWO2_01_FULL_37_25b]
MDFNLAESSARMKSIFGAVKLKKVCLFLGKHAFFFILFMILLELIFGGFLYYNYAFLAEKEKPENGNNYFKFEDSAYQEILKEWEKREIELQEPVRAENYKNPF